MTLSFAFVALLALQAPAVEPDAAPAPPAPQSDPPAAAPGAAPSAVPVDDEQAAILAEALAEAEAAAAADAQAAEDENVTIVGRKRDLARTVGSAHKIDAETLERFEADDINRVLVRVPGVYLREEDGFGLRPNIGLRGASSDRSSKVTLLEDGVLLAPAPYAASAAYYFPMPTRLTGVEVFKGPAAIRHGPHTIGGAINLLTRPIPFGPAGAVDVGAGAYGYGKAHAWGGTGTEYWGVLFEAARVQSDGFKRLDPPVSLAPNNSPLGDFHNRGTGFVRDDVMMKARLNSDLTAALVHSLELKLGYGSEDSNETYLGLTLADFQKDPLRRYATSALDRMEWRRTQAQLSYNLRFQDLLDVRAVVYRHDLRRSWRRVNDLRSGPGISNVLRLPDAGQNAVYVGLLRGETDSVDDSEAILLVTNDRSYVSQGLQTTAALRLSFFGVSQRIEAGVRLHNDEIRRDHTENGYLVQARTLVSDGRPERVTVMNTGSAVALAAWVHDEIRWGDLTVAPGVRVETIGTSLENRLLLEENPDADDALATATQYAILPGIGASWQPLPWLVVLGGVHRGFSPVGPGNPDGTIPEEAINYEAGLRLLGLGTTAEVIGFVSHYSNLTGECTYSTGCVDDLNTQFDGGAALVGGAEVSAGQEVALGKRLKLRIDATYTLTMSQFLSTFSSPNPLFGDVEAGDSLPYVPEHQGAVTSALTWGKLDLGVIVGLTSAMRDIPGQGPLDPLQKTDGRGIVDAVASWRLLDNVTLSVRGDNLLNDQAVTSLRPFGARPSKPLTFAAGLKVEL